MSLVSTKIQMVWQHRPNWSAARVVVGSDYANQNNWSRPRRSLPLQTPCPGRKISFHFALALQAASRRR